jgi:formylglycine-generating enzyme required for sulfatase activity
VVFAEDTTVIDSAGHRLQFLRGGRFVRGTSGAESALTRAFPLSATGQYFGKPEDPAHVTWITKPFYLADSEVTVGQFKTFVAATNYRTSAERGKTKMVGWDPTDPELPLYKSYDFRRASEFNWKNSGFKQGDDHPVVGVSWADAKAYCAWLSKREGHLYRLPTEAEWEFACRAGSETWFSFGDKAVGVVQQFANLGNVELENHRKHAAERQWLLDWEHDPEDGHIFTAPVGSYQANAWGLRDMHGNVWEWCEDLWLDTVYSEFRRPRYNEPNGMAIDPLNLDQPQTPTNDFHSIRGGSWYNGDVFCRSANRTYWDREDAACYIGFRVVRDVPGGRDNSAREALQREQAAIRRIKAAGGKILSNRGLDIEVAFSGKSIDEQALSALASLSNLQRVRTSHSAELSPSGFAAITRLTHLRLLDLRGPFDPDSFDLARLAGLQ